MERTAYFSHPSVQPTAQPFGRVWKRQTLHERKNSHLPQEAEPLSAPGSQIQLPGSPALGLAQHRGNRYQLLFDGIASSAKSSLKLENTEKVRVSLGINPIPGLFEILKTMTRNPPTIQPTQTFTLYREFQQHHCPMYEQSNNQL